MLSGFKSSVQSELNAFFAHLANQADFVRKASAQAFSNARKQFSHQAFTRLNQQLLTLVSNQLTVPRWNGLRVVAADASTPCVRIVVASNFKKEIKFEIRNEKI